MVFSGGAVNTIYWEQQLSVLASFLDFVCHYELLMWDSAVAGKVIQFQQRLSQIGGKVKDFFSGGKKKAPENDAMSNLQVQSYLCIVTPLVPTQNIFVCQFLA